NAMKRAQVIRFKVQHPKPMLHFENARNPMTMGFVAVLHLQRGVMGTLASGTTLKRTKVGGLPTTASRTTCCAASIAASQGLNAGIGTAALSTFMSAASTPGPTNRSEAHGYTVPLQKFRGCAPGEWGQTCLAALAPALDYPEFRDVTMRKTWRERQT